MRQGEETDEKAAVRFGGYRGPEGYVFELTGGAFCLDFANTLDNRPTALPRELLRKYEDLVVWGVQAGSIPDSTARMLRRRARRDPGGAARALERARDAREFVFQLFSAQAEGRPPPALALAGLNAALSGAYSSRRLASRGSGTDWEWPDTDPPDLDRVVWPALVSAAELLTSGESSRVRECDGERCAWLFLDRSRNRSRRWCDMSVCGNRLKARRHHERTKARPRGS